MTAHKEKDNAFPSLFSAGDMAESMEEVAVDVIETEHQNVISRWFRSGKDVDLYVWEDEHKNLIKQQLSFCGQVVEWNILDGVKTGLVLEDEHQTIEDSGAAESIRYDQRPVYQTIQQAFEIIDKINIFESSYKRELINNFKNAPQINNMLPDDFIRKFGAMSGSVTESQGILQTWVERFTRWIKD